MTLAKTLAALGVLAMSAVLVFAFAAGDFAREGASLVAMPWGIVSLVDLYVGFALFSGWILYRQGPTWQAVVWVILIMVLGFFSASLYVYIALGKSRGDWRRFWMGSRAG